MYFEIGQARLFHEVVGILKSAAEVSAKLVGRALSVGISTIFYSIYSALIHFFIGIWTIIKLVFSFPIKVISKNKNAITK